MSRTSRFARWLCVLGVIPLVISCVAIDKLYEATSDFSGEPSSEEKLAAEFARGLRVWNPNGLLRWIHPDVLESFGRAQCAAALTVDVGEAEIRLHDLGEHRWPSWRNAEGDQVTVMNTWSERAYRFEIQFGAHVTGSRWLALWSSPSFDSGNDSQHRPYLYLDCSRRFCDEKCHRAISSLSFFRSLQAALDAGDAEALLPMVHPDVLDSFGAERCATALQSCSGRMQALGMKSVRPVDRGCWRTAQKRIESLVGSSGVVRAELEFWGSGGVGTKRKETGVLVDLEAQEGPHIYLDCEQKLCGGRPVPRQCPGTGSR